MEFSALTNGMPFYVLRKSDKPFLEVGVVKQKSQPRAQYPMQTPNVGMGLQMQQVVDITATINGKDETFPNLPVNVEIAQKGNDTFSGSREAMLHQYGMNNVPDDVLENYAEEQLKKRENIEGYVERAIDVKLMQALKQVVKLNVKEVTFDEFNKMMQE